MTHPYCAYWDRGVESVPQMTGAMLVADAADLRLLMHQCGVALPLPNVLDVGCGTGRAAQICAGYHGVDIAPSMVEFCRRQGLAANVIDGARDLPPGPFGWILCISVCTHIDADERRAYLAAFRDRSERLFIDIIPGDGSGEVRVWTAAPEEFARDLATAGWRATREIERLWDSGIHATPQIHRYYCCEGA